METNLEVLNKISQKLGGSADATSVTESLNNIANALGDTNPDVIKSVSDSLNDILEYAGGGGGSVPTIEITVSNQRDDVYETSSFNGAGYVFTEIPAGQSGKIRDLYNLSEDEAYPIINWGEDYFSVSDLVNCTFVDGTIYITDQTKNASASAVVKST